MLTRANIAHWLQIINQTKEHCKWNSTNSWLQRDNAMLQMNTSIILPLHAIRAAKVGHLLKELNYARRATIHANNVMAPRATIAQTAIAAISGN